MRLPESKVEKLVSKEPLRFALSNVYLETGTPEKGYLVATNGKALVVHPVDLDEGDTSGMITPDQIKRGRRKENGREILIDGEVHFPLSGSREPRPGSEVGTFPDWKVIIPTETAEFTLHLGAELLELFCSSIKSGTVKEPTRLTFHVNGKGDPVRVEASNGAYGVIMPLPGKD